MAVRHSFTETLGSVLDAAENASPLQAVAAVTDALAEALGASAAFFLIADIDSPRGGLIKVSPQNLTSLEQSIRVP